MELRHSMPITVRDHQTESTKNLEQLMRMLAGLNVRPHFVVSLTLDTRWRDEHHRQRVRLFVREEGKKLRAAIKDDDLATIVAADLLRAEAIVEERIRRASSQGGLALYLCGPADLELELATRETLPMRMTIGHLPSVRPLVEGLRDPGAALVVAVDNTESRIYQLTPDGQDYVAGAARAVPRRSKAGGWSSLTVQHHRIEKISEGHRAGAQALAKLFDDRGGCTVLLVGQTEPLGSFEKQLPARVAERAVRAGNIAAIRDEKALLALVDETLDGLELERGATTVQELESIAAEGRGAVGAKAVATALNEQRVQTLVLSQRVCIDGWLCSACGTLGEGERQSCTACNAPVDACELGEAMTRRALLQGAEVEILDEATGIGRLGVAAELRFPTVH